MSDEQAELNLEWARKLAEAHARAEAAERKVEALEAALETATTQYDADMDDLKRLARNAAVRAGANKERAEALKKALLPLVRIADAYDANELDDEARKFWGLFGEQTSTARPEDVDLYQGRGGKTLLTLADCLAARSALRTGGEPLAEPLAGQDANAIGSKRRAG